MTTTRCIALLACLCLAASLVVAQESCRSPNNRNGVCTVFPDCPVLLNQYNTQRNNPQVINFLIQSQRNCGNRSFNRNPVVCCEQGGQVQQTTTTPAPTINNGVLCSDPQGVSGSCKNIRDCTQVYNEFLSRRNDPAFANYVQQSNARCNFVNQNVCCPLVNQPPVTQAPVTTPPVTQSPVTQAPPTSAPSTGGKGGWPAGNPNDYPARLLTPEEGCGYSNETLNRIVGGVPAKLGQWPWMTLIGYRDASGEVGFKCGGSIITKRHILTAAHCIRSDLALVRLGEHDTDTDTETQHIEINVVNMVKHPKYDKKDGHSDLAILTLERDIPFTIRISPICLPIKEPVRSKDFEGFMPFVAGWGRTTEGGNPASVLQELQIPILAKAQCVDTYKAIGKLISQKQFDNAILCAGHLEGGKDSCQGDSGGPLMIPQKFQRDFLFYQIGVVSYGIGCARQNVPGVYASVQNFIDWIQQQTS